MSDKNKQDKEHSKISMRIGDVHVEFEGTSENIKKMMADKEMFDFAKNLEAASKQAPPSTESAPKATAKAPEAAPKEKTVPPPIKASTTPGAPVKKPLPPPSKTMRPGKKETNWKNLALASIIVMIVLLASMAGVIAVYVPLAVNNATENVNAQLEAKDANITALNANITSLNSQISSLQSRISSNTETIKELTDVNQYLNSQIASYLLLNTTTYIYTEETLTQNASESTTIFQDVLNYAGYVGVTVQSTSSTTYVQLYYAYKGVIFNQNVTTATSGTAYFPILPTGITINVGNTDTYTGDTVNATLSVTYYH
jgi:cell division protein FtsB